MNQHEIPEPNECCKNCAYSEQASRTAKRVSVTWMVIGYEPRELTPEQAAIEEEEFQSIVNEASMARKVVRFIYSISMGCVMGSPFSGVVLIDQSLFAGLS